MSAAARWSYTARATLWPLLGVDGWDAQPTFGAPVSFLCDYTSKTETRRDAKGREFVSRLRLFTERADIKPGDRVLLGSSTAANPIQAGALEVMDVGRNADTFDRKADDFEVIT